MSETPSAESDAPRCQHVSPSPWGPTQCALPEGHEGRHAYSPSESVTSPPATIRHVHDHAPYRPVCNEREVGGQLRGACLNDDGTSVLPPGGGR